MQFIIKTTTLILSILCITAAVFYYFLPKPILLKGTGYSQAIYDDHHQLLRLSLSADDKYRLYTPLNQISPTLIQAVLMKEDRYFYRHWGVNPGALGKALWKTYVTHSKRMGASTITMQLARLQYHLNTKTLSGKLKQIYLALQLERHYSKSAILEAYFTLAPYGDNIEGIGAASLIYFNKLSRDLTLSEILTLSLLPQNPAINHAPKSRLWSLRQALYRQWLTYHPQDHIYQSTIALPLQMRSIHQLPFTAPHFVHNALSKHINHTTLDSRLQRLITQVTQSYLKQTARLGVNNAAVMVVDSRDMSVKALLGSVDFFSSAISGQIDGTAIQRSPGSTLKPFIYALAFDQGLIHPATVLKDMPKRFGYYNPENFDYEFMGPLSAHDALMLSRNIPAIDLANQLNHPNLYQLLLAAQVKHLKSSAYYGLSLSLGGAELSMQELVSLYAMLANEGRWQALRFSSKNPLLAASQRLLSKEACFLVLDILKDTPRPSSTASDLHSLMIPWKTGTSAGFRDAWTVGLAGPYVIAVWLGNFNQQSNPALVGKTMAAPLFFNIITAMKHALPQAFHQTMAWQTPYHKNLTQVTVCKASGLLSTPWCPKTLPTWFIPGKSPIKKDTVYREVAINTQTGLRTCHIDEHTQFAVFEFWPSDILGLLKQAGIYPHTVPPYENVCKAFMDKSLTAPEIVSPFEGHTYAINLRDPAPLRIPFMATVDGDVKWLYWFVNGQLVYKSRPNETYFWTATSGRYTVRLVDDHGMTDSRNIEVAAIG